MKKLMALGVAVALGLCLGVAGAPQAAADCEGNQVAQVQVDSDATSQVHPVLGHVEAEVWVNPDHGYPVSVAAGANGPFMNCSDSEIEYIVEDPERFLGDVEAIVLFLLDQLLP